MKRIVEKLIELQDKKYRDFQSSLIPTVNKNDIIGIRTPELKKFAKELINEQKAYGQYEKFLGELPHKYFDENQLHAFILNEIKDFDTCIELVNKFLPYIDNWATCDQLSPKCFKKNKKELLKYIDKWINSKKAYFIRFAICCLMQYFLEDDFDKKYLDKVANIKFDTRATKSQKILEEKAVKKEKISVDIDPNKYYVEMMRAWYFATALAKQYKATLPYIKKNKLNEWTHNKTIQKAIESYRISDIQKKELRKYIIKKS